MRSTADVAVVGAGVIGSAIAYELSARGAGVVLLESDAIGSGASAHATGSLNMLGAEFSPGPSFDLGLLGYRMFADLAPRLREQTGIDLLYQRRPSSGWRWTRKRRPSFGRPWPGSESTCRCTGSTAAKCAASSRG